VKVHQIEVGNMQNFTYILEDEDTGEAIILDPSWNLDEIQQIITRKALTVLRSYIRKRSYFKRHRCKNYPT